MGVIQRQVFKNNLIAILAVVVGAISNIWIYPLDLETKGYADALLKWARLLMPFFVLGVGSVMIKYPSYLKGEGDRASSQLFTRAVMVVSAAVGSAALILLLFGNRPLTWVDTHLTSLGLFVEQPWVVLALLASFCYTLVLKTNLVNYQRIAVPEVFDRLLPKLGLPLLILGIVYWNLSSEGFTIGLVALYASIVLGLYGYSVFLGKHRFTAAPLELDEPRRREMYALAGFSILGSVGSALCTQLDVLFVNEVLGNAITGVYSFATFAAMVMAIPNQAITSIAGPIVSSSWKDGDIDHLAFLYKQSASVLFAVGGFIYVGGLLCLPQVIGISSNPEGLALAMMVFVYLGASQLVDLMTSINGMIIGYSDYFRWNTFFVVFLGVLNLGLNYFFLVTLDMGIVGPAIATLISLILYNTVKVIFVYRKSRIHPFTTSLAKTALVLAGIWLGINWFPSTNSLILDFFIRGSLASGLFLAYLYFTTGVPQIHHFLRDGNKALFKK